MIIDTNILHYAFKDKNSIEIDLKFKSITSINALEFLRNIEKKHNNKAKYYLPTPTIQAVIQLELLKKLNHPWSKHVSDVIFFDFKNDFDSYALYNNESISQVINSKATDIYNSAIYFFDKPEYKKLKEKFKFILKNDINCISLNENDIELGYDLLRKFLSKYSLKDDFRNCWNDILILSKAINLGEVIYTSDNLLQQFASEIYNGELKKQNGHVTITFPSFNFDEIKVKRIESKNYINKSWEYKIRRGN